MVCEGIPDALTASALGHHAVGILASQSLDDSVAMIIGRHARDFRRGIVLVNDHDGAGQAWASRLTNPLEGVGIESTTFQPPGPGMGLNSWLFDQRNGSVGSVGVDGAIGLAPVADAVT